MLSHIFTKLTLKESKMSGTLFDLLSASFDPFSFHSSVYTQLSQLPPNSVMWPWAPLYITSPNPAHFLGKWALEVSGSQRTLNATKAERFHADTGHSTGPSPICEARGCLRTSCLIAVLPRCYKLSFMIFGWIFRVHALPLQCLNRGLLA